MCAAEFMKLKDCYLVRLTRCRRTWVNNKYRRRAKPYPSRKCAILVHWIHYNVVAEWRSIFTRVQDLSVVFVNIELDS